MAKKSSSVSLFLIGMIVVAVGCFLPLTASKFFGGGASAFDAITSSGNGAVKVGAILALAGAVAGIIFSFVSLKGVPIRLISLIVSIAGGLYVLIKYLNIGGAGKSIVKGLAKATGTNPGIGLIVIIIGWIIAIIGYVKSRK